MEIVKVTYEDSYTSVEKCPDSQKPEYAFIGRSNVGKSSLINLLTGRKDIAHVSRQPGKTQLINFFAVEDRWYFVDLPGYGYAKVPKKIRNRWKGMINNYLLKRTNLQCTFVLIDANVPPQNKDLDFINWLGENQIPFVIIFTKIDKLKPSQLSKNINAFNEAMLESWETLPTEFFTSATKRIGRENILNFIEEINERFYTN